MSDLAKLGPSPEHAKYQAILPEFFARVEKQEARAVESGIPAAGLAAFARKWFDAWGNQSLEQLSDCMSPDCNFIDSSTFQQVRRGREITLENSRQAFSAFPDLTFYPQDNTVRNLPYLDWSEGQLRVLIPWRGIGRFTGSLTIPDTDISIAPTGRCMNFIGIDRYLMTADMKIAHIDTDWDIAFVGMQLSPVGLRKVPWRLVRSAAAVERAVMPMLRRLPLPNRPGVSIPISGPL